jgi:hypothetical protein
MTRITIAHASLLATVLLAWSAAGCSDATAPSGDGAAPLPVLERLGQRIFEDTNLSIGKN